MLKQHIVSSSLLPDPKATCRINSPLIIDDSLTAQSMTVNGNVSVDHSVATEGRLDVDKNTTVSGKVKIDGLTTIQEGLFMTNGSDINMNNKKVINVPTHKPLSSLNNTLACNYGMMRYPIFYCKTSTSTTDHSWGEGDLLPWNILTGRLYRSPDFNNYFRFENNSQLLRILRTGFFQFSISINKRRGWDNGYGEHILLRDMGNAAHPLCREHIWSKGGYNLQICLNAALQITKSTLAGSVFRIDRENGGGSISISMFSFSILGFIDG